MNPIYPGGTQLQSFVVPFPADNIEKAIVTYKQDGAGIILEKTVTVFSDTDDGKAAFSYRLTQKESLLFRDFIHCSMQVNLLMTDGTREPSETWIVECAEQYHRAVIT